MCSNADNLIGVGRSDATTKAAERDEQLYEDSFRINSDLVDGETLKPMVHRLAALDIYNKYGLNTAKIQSLHFVVGAETTVQYSFLAGKEFTELNNHYAAKEPKISLPTETFAREIMEASSDTTNYINLDKLAMTFRDPDTGTIYFQTHTGKVYDNHFALGPVPEKRKEDGKFINVKCEHEFKTVEQQTRSGDEEITVTKICVKCNADHRNLKTIPEIIPDSIIKDVAEAIYELVDQECNFEDAYTLARVMASLED